MIFKCHCEEHNPHWSYVKYSFFFEPYDSVKVGEITIEAQDGLFVVGQEYEINIKTIQEIL